MEEKINFPLTGEEPEVLIDESTLYWHFFCHCSSYETSFCGGQAVKPNNEVGGSQDGAEAPTPINQWDGLGEFCPFCVILVKDACPWTCACGECRVLSPRSRWWKFWEKRKSMFS